MANVTLAIRADAQPRALPRGSVDGIRASDGVQLSNGGVEGGDVEVVQHAPRACLGVCALQRRQHQQRRPPLELWFERKSCESMLDRRGEGREGDGVKKGGAPGGDAVG